MANLKKHKHCKSSFYEILNSEKELLLFINFSEELFMDMKTVYLPRTKEELRSLCDDASIHLGDIDTSKITDMSGLFEDSERKDFSGIEYWNMSNITDMRCMFAGAEAFNQDISKWDVSNVENFSYMFYEAKSFNQPIGNWDTSSAQWMEYMFKNAEAFNQPIDNWHTSGVEDMTEMFAGAKAFNQPIGNWDVSKVEDMQNMFASSGFHQFLSKKWAKMAGYNNPPVLESERILRATMVDLAEFYRSAGVPEKYIQRAIRSVISVNKQEKQFLR